MWDYVTTFYDIHFHGSVSGLVIGVGNYKKRLGKGRQEIYDCEWFDVAINAENGG